MCLGHQFFILVFFWECCGLLEVVMGLTGATEQFDTVCSGQKYACREPGGRGAKPSRICTVSMLTPACETSAADTLVSASPKVEQS